MLKSIVDLYASLILAPVVLLAPALLFGSGGSWTQFQSFEPNESSLVTIGAGGAFQRETVQLALVSESSPIETGRALLRGQFLG